MAGRDLEVVVGTVHCKAPSGGLSLTHIRSSYALSFVLVLVLVLVIVLAARGSRTCIMPRGVRHGG